MQATVQVDAQGAVMANLDTDDYADDDDSVALLALTTESMLEQCARVAIETWLKLHADKVSAE